MRTQSIVLKTLRQLPDIPALLICVFLLTIFSPVCAAFAGTSSQFLEICTLNGIKKIQIDSDQGDDDTPPSLGHLHDCSFCHLKSYLMTPVTGGVENPHIISYDMAYKTQIAVVLSLSYKGFSFHQTGPPRQG